MARHPEVYKNKQWPRVREFVIIRANGLCEKCGTKGIIKPGKEVDHIIELTDDNKNDWNIAFNPVNLQYLCTDCHNHKSRRSTGLQDFLTPPIQKI
jgi:5-methylcytosine-specific restriction endonuclease McrA